MCIDFTSEHQGSMPDADEDGDTETEATVSGLMIDGILLAFGSEFDMDFGVKTNLCFLNGVDVHDPRMEELNAVHDRLSDLFLQQMQDSAERIFGADVLTERQLYILANKMEAQAKALVHPAHAPSPEPNPGAGWDSDSDTP